MKRLNQTQIKMLQILSDGQSHTGTAIGEALGISRTAVWKHVNQMVEYGVPINSARSSGYQLSSSMILLNTSEITNHLNKLSFKHPFHLHVFHTIDSTNLFLKSLPSNNVLEICCSEMQTMGRGRFNRNWYSPFGENIYCSSRWIFHCDLSALSGLSLVISLAVRHALAQYIPLDELYVKWPNDLLWQGKKLSGILIEVQGESHGGCEVIIGIGLNVNALAEQHQKLDKPWSSLREICGNLIDRNQLIAQLISTLATYIHRYNKHGFSSFEEEWKGADYLMNKQVTVLHPAGDISGIACGVTQAGQLCVKDDKKIIRYLSSGDASLRGKN